MIPTESVGSNEIKEELTKQTAGRISGNLLNVKFGICTEINLDLKTFFEGHKIFELNLYPAMNIKN